MIKNNYGHELILDLHKCDISTFTRKSIRKYLKELCQLIKMERCDLHWWDYLGVPNEEYQKLPTHLKGISVVQFISTSTIVLHTLDDLGEIFINIFSCKDFNADEALYFSANWFKGNIKRYNRVERG